MKEKDESAAPKGWNISCSSIVRRWCHTKGRGGRYCDSSMRIRMRDPPTNTQQNRNNSESIMGRSAIGHEQRPIHPPNDPGSGQEGVMMWEASGGKLVEWKTDDSSSGHYRQPKPMARCDSRDGHPDRTVGVKCCCKPSSQSRPSLVITPPQPCFTAQLGFLLLPRASSFMPMLEPLSPWGSESLPDQRCHHCVHA